MSGRESSAGGFTIIEILISMGIIAIIAAIAIPNLIEARKGANESAAISSLRTLVTVQSLFRSRDTDGDGIDDYAESIQEPPYGNRCVIPSGAKGER